MSEKFIASKENKLSCENMLLVLDGGNLKMIAAVEMLRK